MMMRGKLNQLLFSDPVLKIFSVILGCSLFLLVRQDRVKELDIQIPVLLDEVGETRIFTGDAPASVRVRVRGRWSSMLRVLESRPAPYEVTLSAQQDGSTFVFDEKRLQDLIGVSNLSVITVEPAAFDVRIQEKKSRVVPINVAIEGQVSEEYIVDPGALSYEPKSVVVMGPASEIDKIDGITSYPVRLDGLTRDLRADIWLKRPSAPFVTLGSDQITVQIAVHEREGEKLLEDVPVFVEKCQENMICRPVPSTVDVRVRGSLPRIRWMEEQEGVRWVVVNAEEVSSVPGRYRNSLLFSRPVEGVVLVPKPRKVALIVQEFSPPEEEMDADQDAAAPEPPTEKAAGTKKANTKPDKAKD